MTERSRTATRSVLLRMISWYQRAFSGRPSPCRFFPSCSEYARLAIEQHGAGRGSLLAVRRLLRCRPFGPSGFDPVPERRSADDPAGCDRHLADRDLADDPHPALSDSRLGALHR